METVWKFIELSWKDILGFHRFTKDSNNRMKKRIFIRRSLIWQMSFINILSFLLRFNWEQIEVKRESIEHLHTYSIIITFKEFSPSLSLSSKWENWNLSCALLSTPSTNKHRRRHHRYSLDVSQSSYHLLDKILLHMHTHVLVFFSSSFFSFPPLLISFISLLIVPLIDLTDKEEKNLNDEISYINSHTMKWDESKRESATASEEEEEKLLNTMHSHTITTSVNWVEEEAKEQVSWSHFEFVFRSWSSFVNEFDIQVEKENETKHLIERWEWRTSQSD